MAGTISRIRLENFMCHSSLHIELGQHVNFITGQNGSGKSAILTALCIAFGSRAKSTQRASALKDFIKTGCSYAAIIVDINNQGEDAFKPEVYGDLVRLERRITESRRKVAHRKDDLIEIIEHFNIDVENPCVIMSQDKSREFLHSGNNKDKFKATLLQHVNDLLLAIRELLDNADSVVQELEKSIKPAMRELDELQQKIKNMEHIEEIAHEIDNLKKKLAWSWVYDVDRQIEEQTVKLLKLKERIPACQEKIDGNAAMIVKLKEELTDKEINARSLVEKSREVTMMKEKLEDDIAQAVALKIELEREHVRGTNVLKNMNNRVKQLQKQIHDFRVQYIQYTQDESSKAENDMCEIQQEINSLHSNVTRLKEEERGLHETQMGIVKSIQNMETEIVENRKKITQLKTHIRDLQQRQSDKVSTFGGQRVRNLLKSIERQERRFNIPPLGPIGVHVKLASESWSFAVECALGRLLDAFIVSCHRDSVILRECAKEVNYHNLQIIIYDFAKPRLNIPDHLLPSTTHPTVLSVIHSENPTVLNVLVDQGSAERTVLVRDYEVGRSVAFDNRIQNLKDVYTSDGYKMFSRGPVQTILPPHRKGNAGRLCTSLGEKIAEMESEIADMERIISQRTRNMKNPNDKREDIELKINNLKRKRVEEERLLESKKVQLDDIRKTSADINRVTLSDTSELEAEMMQVEVDIEQKELLVQKINLRLTKALQDENDRRACYKEFIDGVYREVGPSNVLELEIERVKDKLQTAEQGKAYYEGIMENKVLPDIKIAEAEFEDLQKLRQESFMKASIICSESDVETLGGVAGSSPEQLSATINKLELRFHKESSRYTESIDGLRALHIKKKEKIKDKQQLYEGFRDKLNSCQKALDMRWKKFQRNAALLKRQLTWLFNEHLGKKGISGFINVDYKERLLSVELTMPQDASRDTITDTRGLSGGERSFSTLCFTLALHGMTEAPFRAMDEFDVFMDAVSRKISLDTLVDFAVTQGSQWIFITPHDISMVQPGDRIKKQQMAAPRG
uniref:RecF/RecN/SMC N-terminal domain-containing protein n=1 Tax=Oryza punctata TaxID=4537 RepID=A0A0E0LYC2_ORYPU